MAVSLPTNRELTFQEISLESEIVLSFFSCRKWCENAYRINHLAQSHSLLFACVKCSKTPQSHLPDGSRSLAQVVAELQDPFIKGQRDEVSFSIRFLAVVEDQTVRVVGHEDHCHADLLTGWKHKKKQ